MNRKARLFRRLCENGIIGVVREESREAGLEVARTFARNGLTLIEVTMTTPDAIDILSQLKQELAGSDVTLAAGSLRGDTDAAAARKAGAEILVSPHTDLRLIDYGSENDMLVISGAATATEIIHAWERGADVIKLYPALHLGGADFVRTLKQPIRDIPLLAGGPVSIDSIRDYLHAGVVAVNLGASLAPPESVNVGDWEEIGRRVQRAVREVRAFRGISPAPTTMVH